MEKLIIPIAALSWPRTFLCAALIAGLYYITFFNDGTQLRSQLVTAESEFKTAETVLQQNKTAVADANRFEQEVKDLANQFKEITKFMPEKMRTAELTNLISDLATKAGVKLKGTEPIKAKDTQAFYETSRLQFSVEGKFPQIAILLSYLTRTSRLLTLEKMSLVNDAQVVTDIESPKLTFSATIVGYRYIGENTDSTVAPLAKPKSAHNVLSRPVENASTLSSNRAMSARLVYAN